MRRLLLWGLPVLVVILVAALVLAWYARRSTWYVGLDGEDVALYRGVPGGFLVWDPTVEEVADLEVSDLTPSDLEKVRDGHTFSSRSSAEDFIDRLEREAEDEDRAREQVAVTSTTRATTTTSAAVPPADRPTTIVQREVSSP